MKGPKRLLARHGAQANEERNGRTPVRKLVATFCAVAMSVGMAGVSMSAYADDQQPAEDATTTVEATPEAQPTEDATVDAQPEAEATDAAEADAQPEAVTADAPTVLAAGDANDTTGGLGDLEHSKTVTEKGDNQYTLNLGVTGKTSSMTETGEKPKLDVVLVLDTSGSMADNKRLQTMKNAITGTDGLSDALFTDNLDTQATIITYATEAQNLGTYSNGKKTSFNKMIDDLQAGGGTQWDDGLALATRVQARKGAQKYVVFLTDGDPGQTQGFGGDAPHVYNNSVTYGQDLVKAGWNILNVGVDMTDNARVNPDVNSVSAECTEYIGTLFRVCVTRTGYTTYNRSSYWKKWVSPLEALNAREVAVKTADQTVRAYPKTDTASLTQVFKDLATIITTTTDKAASSLVITDTISKWVEPVGIKTDAEGNVTQGVTVIRSDTNAAVAPTSIKSITFKDNTLTVTFADGFVLSKGVTYTVQYDIQPSQAAFDYYAANGRYPNTSTTEGASTSGFFSNENASFSYQECTTVNNVPQGCEPHEVDFLHPVIETDFADAIIGDTDNFLQVKKTVEGSKGWGGNDTFQFTLKADRDAPMPENAQNGEATITLAKPETGDEQTGNFGKITYSQIGTYTYTVTETAGDGSYQYSHAAYKVTVTVTRDAVSRSLKAAVAVQQTHGDEANDTTGDPQANKMPMAFVNQNAMVTLDAETIGVKKTVNGTDTDQDFAFTMTATGDNRGDVKWPNANQASSTLKITDSFTNGEQKEAKFADALEFPVPSSKTETATYTLQVKEDYADNPPAGWNYDKSEKTVTVTVQYDTTQNKWIATADRAIVDFTNTWVAVSNLPLTGEGGATPMLWLAIGGGLGALALLAAGGAAIWRKRRLI